MTNAEWLEMVKELKESHGMDDQMILITLYAMYQDDKITEDELKNLIGSMGYEFTEEFAKLSDDEKKSQSLEFDDDETEETETESDDTEDDEEFKSALKYFGK